ncbi:MAG: hypothetical protein HQL28_06125 [Candidatus Omnitrophica bacterium]|nr:hypothetical protein [Candidatus Omnitrophota bacterium]
MTETIQVKKPRPIFDRRSIFFSICILCLFGCLTALILKNTKEVSEAVKGKASWSADKIKTYANRLKADGLIDQSAEAFEEYLDKANPGEKTRANIYFSLGEMYYKAKRYEDALAYFYKSETAYEDASLKSDIGNYIVHSLENMGKPLDAEYQLESRALLKGEKKEKKYSGEVRAKIEDREITMGELNAEAGKMPEWFRKAYAGDDAKKLDLLRQYIAEELLYAQGTQMGYKDDPEIRGKMEDYAKQLVLQKMLLEKVVDKIQSDPEDVKNFYEANKAKYKNDKGEIKPFEEVKDLVGFDYKQEKTDKMTQGILEGLANSKNVQIFEEKFKVAKKETAPAETKGGTAQIAVPAAGNNEKK